MKHVSAFLLVCCIDLTGGFSNLYAHDSPNIILMIADDLNWDDLGCYGNKVIRTPHLDNMAAEGLRFERAYVTASSCSPSRASIITGKYPHQTGAEQLHWPLPAGTQTFVKALKEAGYYTAAAGKWHLGDNIRDHFDEIHEASTAGFVLPTGDGDQPAKMIAQSPSGCEDWVQTVKDAQSQEKPYFLWLASLDPHREYEEEAWEPYDESLINVPAYLPDTPEVRHDFNLYYQEISRLDDSVGKVMALLPKDVKPGFRSTIVFFISDNGRPFPRAKTTLYEDGIRTPLIVHWHGFVEAGRVSQSLVSTVDLAPTIRHLAGIRGQQSEAAFVRNLLDAEYDSESGFRKYAFGEDHWHDYEDHARSITDGHFKLIHNDYPDLPNTPPADAGRSLTWEAMLSLKAQGKLNEIQSACFVTPRPEWEFYDLKDDPNEFVNLISQSEFARDIARMKTEFNKWSDQTEDYLPTKRTPDEFNRVTGEPDNTVRKRPRPSKKEMFGTNGKY